MTDRALQDLQSDLLTAGGAGASRIKAGAVAQGQAMAATGSSAFYAPAPGLHQALREASRATGAPGAPAIAARVANSMGDAAVNMLAG
jgi:hypothetical protein